MIVTEASTVLVAAAAIRVVVVGGAGTDLAVLRSVAAVHGFTVHPVELGAGLLAAIDATRPDAIVLDADQRGTTGHTLCATLRDHAPLARVPVIFTSSEHGPEARRRGYDAGCDDFVEKPINRAQLGERVRALVRLSRRIAAAPP